ncbi:hypothetical protein S14_130 [Shewanella sp. phage 1/4]|uniref:hypothetical protein n=1 Tax=Shewanella phage 1/4 TaxID=1458859 RepID=UPI0004F6EB6E|nr:hypothetical protein S14_130 [Shewanella sp. phage 1/4]AHK11239.1 hypothetical protein S14_130 [Shewanella sp. phage 1/4]
MHKKIIVAAANVYRVTNPEGITREVTLVDNCHGGRNMQEVVSAFKAFGCEVKMVKELEDLGQGFIDECGLYYDRGEAYLIAKSSGQPFNDQYTLPRNRLDSSCVRHFKSDEAWVNYMTGEV